MLGDLFNMLGKLDQKLEKLELKFGGNFPQLSTGEISRKKYIPDIPKCLRNP